jgi:hypothetical protein
MTWLVGGTRFHRTIHEASLGRMPEKEKTLTGRLFVSLDRADAFIEGGPDVKFEKGFGCPVLAF